jgi:mono/diheme cytochrome c family protein
MKSTSPTRRWSLAAFAAAAVSACDMQPHHSDMHYDLSASTVEALDDRPAAQDKLLGALEMLFGTPQNPGYMLLEDWADDDYDPNWPSYAADDRGSGEFDDDELEALHADNRRRFASELAAVAEKRWDAIGGFRTAPRLESKWRGLLADFRAEEVTEDELAEEARPLFEEYYPSLEDSAELYRQQCLHCHGVEGGGDGPTAGTLDNPYLDPLPRDYRKGVFKYTAVKDKARPRRDDLATVLDQGIYGTAMPSFRRFSIAEREGLVDYVRLLAVRGEVEQLLVLALLDDTPLTPGLVSETFSDVWEKWQEADDKFVAFDGDVPGSSQAMLDRGRELYMDATTGNCFSCHGDQGLGDGVAAWKLDDDGERVPAYEDDWGQPIVPRNLRQGIFRFGRRPIDIYRRIYAGINGGPMPAIGESRGADGELLLTSDDLWAIVHYVRSLAEHPDTLVADAGHGPAHPVKDPSQGTPEGHSPSDASDHTGEGAGH